MKKSRSHYVTFSSPGHTVPRSDYWRPVTATGTFDTAHEVVVRRRTSSDERVGVHILSPLVLKDGR
ncbi:SURF1 family cytochrome oxidase biogenesis protein, partial [Bacillus safensis]|uniref:SURF1 family cytochrome oxidase biogenesis protein n=1 Tax=Bacillus safensis TaxID=561879 RepID=UPI003657CD80